MMYFFKKKRKKEKEKEKQPVTFKGTLLVRKQPTADHPRSPPATSLP
jgi:hypothetical protein